MIGATGGLFDLVLCLRRRLSATACFPRLAEVWWPGLFVVSSLWGEWLSREQILKLLAILLGADLTLLNSPQQRFGFDEI